MSTDKTEQALPPLPLKVWARHDAPDGEWWSNGRWTIVKDSAQMWVLSADRREVSRHEYLSEAQFYARAALTAAPPAQPQSEPSRSCWCASCDMALNLIPTRMSVCPQCGDKRCPRAEHHDSACAAQPPERAAQQEPDSKSRVKRIATQMGWTPPAAQQEPQEPVERNNPISALAIRLLVAAGHVTQEKADEAFRIACYCVKEEARRMNVELPWVGASPPRAVEPPQHIRLMAQSVLNTIADAAHPREDIDLDAVRAVATYITAKP